MLDYIKLEIVGFNVEQLEQNPLLNFESHINEKTGKECKCRHAFYNGLIFSIKETQKKITKKQIIIEGSLHKYYNKGEHNFDDFTFLKIIEAISRLEQEFGFSRFKMLIKEIGIGVNINPSSNSRTIMNGCVNIGNQDFHWLHSSDEGDYKNAILKSITVNIYDKRRYYSEYGYKFKFEIMRFEIRIFDVKQLHLIEIYFISDLLEGIPPIMIKILKAVWSEIHFIELSTDIWKNKENKKCTQNEIDSIVSENILNIFLLDKKPNLASDKIHNEIMKLILEKAEFLCKDAMENTFSLS